MSRAIFSRSTEYKEHKGERQFTFDAAPNYEPYFHPVDASGIYCMLQGTIPGRDGNIHLLKDNELTPQSVTFMYPEDLYLVEHGHYQAIIDGYYGQSNAPAFLFRDGTYVSKQSDYAPLAARLCGNYLYVTNGIDIKVWDDGGTLLLDDRLFNDNSNGESFVTEVGATDYDKTAQMQGRVACITDDKMIHVFDNDFGHMKFDINFNRIA